MTFVVGLLTFGVVIALCLIVLQPVFTQYVDQYAVRVRGKKQTGKESAAEAPKESVLLTTCQTLGEVVLGVLPNLADKRTVQLLQAGNYRTPQHLAMFIGIKSVFVGGSVLFSLLSAASNADPKMILAAPVIGFIGWGIPNFFLASRVKKRQAEVLKELPTIIDLLIVCAQAGLGLLSCVDKVSKEVGESCPVLAAEMHQLLNDVKIFSKSVAHALADMGERCGVEEVVNVASALISAETKGSDISYPLRQQAEALRDKIKRKKEEEAAQTPVKMVPVIMFFVMPLILCPMLGPAIITIMNSLGPVMGGGHK